MLALALGLFVAGAILPRRPRALAPNQDEDDARDIERGYREVGGKWVRLGEWQSLRGRPDEPLRGPMEFARYIRLLREKKYRARARAARALVTIVSECEHCGKRIERSADKTSKKPRFCSLACRIGHYAPRRSEIRARKRALVTARRAELPPSVFVYERPERIERCLVCDADVPEGRLRYCSVRCKRIARERRKRAHRAVVARQLAPGRTAAPRASKPARLCRFCGAPSKSGPFCSAACRLEAARAKERERARER